RRHRGRATAQGGAEIRRRAAQHRHRGGRRTRHPAADAAAACQHRLRLTEDEERALAVAHAPLETLLAESDWVVPQLPAAASTRHFIGAAELARMKPTACIVNVSCPDVINRDALIEALRARRLAGFALDPQYEAPGRSEDELLAFDNVILTPH